MQTRSAADAAATVAGVQWHYAQASRSLAEAALAGARDFVEWAHYPREDAVDPRHGTRFYYHAHAAAERAPGEHGHFHLFVPAADGFSHLAGLSLDGRGLPMRWFTTNRWVTGEHWQSARRLQSALRGFELRIAGRLAPVARWLVAMVRLYTDELQALLSARDARLAAQARRLGRSRALEDRRLHILTECPVDLLAKLAAVASPHRPS